MDPRRPEHPDPFAVAFLDRLKNRPEAEQFVLGGYFALKHYVDDRDTVALFREWREVFDRFPLPDSPSYHALRAHFRWPAVPIEPSFYPAPWEHWTHSKGGSIPAGTASRPDRLERRFS